MLLWLIGVQEIYIISIITSAVLKSHANVRVCRKIDQEKWYGFNYSSRSFAYQHSFHSDISDN